MTHIVFVYGSLMKEFGNHGLLSKASFVSEGHIEGYSLYSLGAFPAVLSSSDDHSIVHGEIYEVGDDTLQALDRLEGHPHFYKREEGTAYCDNRNAYLHCFFYLFQSDRVGEHIPSGSWREHATSNQTHALRS